jgi:spermidine synthase
MVRLLAFVLGAAALTAETAWIPLVANIVGADGLAVQAVLGAFFSGTALGAWTLGRRAERRVEAGAPALREFARLLAAASVGLLISLLAAAAGRALFPRLSWGQVGPGHTALAFVLAVVAFAPATMGLGGALAVLGRGLAPRGTAAAEAVAPLAGLVGWELAGSVAGVLSAGFLLLPVVGVRATVVVAASLCAVAAVIARLRVQPVEAPAPPARQAREPDPRDGVRGFEVAAAGAGAAAIMFEIAALRVLTAAFDGSAAAFGTVTAAQLVGGLVGAAASARVRAPREGAARTFVVAGCGLAAAAVGLGAANDLLAASRASLASERVAESLIALVTVVPAAVMTSFSFTRLLGAAAHRAAGLARLSSASAVGAAAAPAIAALLLTAGGGTRALLVAPVALLSFGALALARGRRARPWRLGVLSACALALAWFSARPARLYAWAGSPGHAPLLLEDAEDGVVTVERAPSGGRRLRTGSRFFDGGDDSRFGERRQGLLPLLLHPAPRRVLVLGVGTGTTLGAIAAHPDVERVDAVDLSGAVLEALPLFEGANGGVTRRANVRVHHADARTFVRAAAARGQRFDVVIGDLFHPQRLGAGALYTREHFAAVAAALAPGGVFVQWLPLHELSPEALAVVLATHASVFPRSEAFLAYFNASTPALGLIGGTADIAGLVARAESPRLRAALEDTLLDRPEESFGGFAADTAALARLAAAGAIATDDQPLVERLAARGAPRFASLTRVLDEGEPSPLPIPTPSDVATASLVSYRRAVFASLRGQMALARGERSEARRFFEEGLAADERLAINRLLLARLR